MSSDTTPSGGISTPNNLRRAPAPVSSVRIWALALAAGLAAGFVSWYGGEAVDGHFKPTLVSVRVMQSESMQPSSESLATTETKNSALVFAILGGALGLALGLSGGLARGDFPAALKAGLVGLFLGTLIGAGATAVVVPAYQRLFDRVSDNLIPPLIAHGAIWSVIGAGAGLAFGVGLGGRAAATRCLMGGLVGGLFGTIAFEIIAAAKYPFDRTFQPISLTSSSRMVARFSVTILTAVGVAIATRVRSGKAVAVGVRPGALS